jgi:hypothetical protein
LGRRPWIYATGTVTDPPSWLKRGTRASFEFTAFDRRDVVMREHRAEVIAGAFVNEVSVLSPRLFEELVVAVVLAYEPRDEVVVELVCAPTRKVGALLGG